MTTKPSNLSDRIWASGAPSGNIVDPDVADPGKLAAGWLAEVPPFEYFNFLHKRITEALAHNNEEGINIWDTNTTYPIGALVKGSNGILYKAIISQNGNDPISDTGTNWIGFSPTKKITPQMFNVVANGSNDNSAGIQAAIDYLGSVGGGNLHFPIGDYRVTATKGTNDKYGININYSNITITADEGASIRRLSPDISTYALAFPILLIGEPDSNNTGDQVSNIKIKGLKFVGENSRHSTSGSALMDGRQAVWVKNARNVKFYGNEFTSIDSSSIWVQKPSEYDYENSVYYNTTKCYGIKIIRNDFIAEEHAVAGRALLHAVNVTADNVLLAHNTFEWCDDCFICDTTYDDYEDKETDTYTDTNLSTSVKRVGRGYRVHANNCYNSSEHCFYLSGMGISCNANNIIVDNATVCNTNQFQIRARGASIVGNEFCGVHSAAAISFGSMDVTFANNPIQSVGDSVGGIVDVRSQGLTAYINGRSDYFGSYKPMRNIIVANNTINMVEAAQTNGIGIRVYTDQTDANFPDGQMINVTIKGNTINNPRKAIYLAANMAKNGKIEGNTLNGKPFTEAGFSTGTTMNSEYALGVYYNLSGIAWNFSFDNNKVYGFEYIMFDDEGTGGAGTMHLPRGIRNNNFDYIKYWDTAAFRQPLPENRFTNNEGQYFLDRTGWYSDAALFNSLATSAGGTEKKSCMSLVSSSDVRIYYDDSNGYKAL